MAEGLISLNEASRIAGVAPSTLQRWARAGVIPVKQGQWTTAAAAQARVVGRMRERGHSLEELRRADRAADGPARNAGRDRGHAQRTGRGCDGADRRGAPRRLPPGRAAATDQG